ncbi:MAG: lipid-A-disaccharide synthase, partial [Pseudomonadota bacterium]
PEFLGPACQPDAIAPALDTLLDDTQARARQIQAMARTLSALGQDGPSPGARAATALLNALA